MKKLCLIFIAVALLALPVLAVEDIVYVSDGGSGDGKVGVADVIRLLKYIAE